MTVSLLLVIFVEMVGWLLPAPADKFGWALRVRSLDSLQPYLAREDIDRARLMIALMNQSDQERKYLLLQPANLVDDLDVILLRPNGKVLPKQHHKPRSQLFFEDRWKLPPGRIDSSDFTFADFGYSDFVEPGEYEVRASLKTAEGVIEAPPIKLTVIEPAPDAILASQQVPLEGYQAKWPKAKQARAENQQIKIGSRTWLVYRKFDRSEIGGKVRATFRLAELPGKVEMSVEGAFGDWNPLTITYKDPTSRTGTTKLVIGSSGGRPWTEEDERLRIEVKKLLKETPTTPIKP